MGSTPDIGDPTGGPDQSVSAANSRPQPSTQTVTIADAHPGDVCHLLSTRNTTKKPSTTANQVQTSSANTSHNGQAHPQSGEPTADIQLRSTRVDFQQHALPMPHQGPNPNVQPFLVTAAVTTRMAAPQNNAAALGVQSPSVAAHTAPAHAIHQGGMQPVLQDIPREHRLTDIGCSCPSSRASIPLFKISTAKMDKAIDNYWTSKNTEATDDQAFS